MTRLTVVLGSGGVGKTTLAAAIALAATRAGRRTVLLGADPARRLRSALGLEHVGDAGVDVAVPGAPLALHASLLEPSIALRRWASVALADDAAAARLARNPLFIVLADRLAGFGDAIACARAVELAETLPVPDEIVLDTAPGLAAVELLTRPQRLMELFDGRVVQSLVRLARFGKAGRTVKALARLSGADLLRDLGELVSAMEGTIAALVRRLERARAWLSDPGTSLVLVCGSTDEAADVTLALAEQLKALSLSPACVALNRALPDSLARWEPPAGGVPAPFVRYVHNQLALQRRVKERLVAAFGGLVREVPESGALEESSRLEALAALGEPLRAASRRAS